jgi:7-cyano-7-deazaguanine synthase
LVSGGVDSSVLSAIAKRNKINTFPLFVDYGQICVETEWKACKRIHRQNAFPAPVRMDISGFGRAIPSGLTSRKLRINEDAFLPCRNLLFVVVGAAYAYSKGASAVLTGLIAEDEAIFPDQTRSFVERAEAAIQTALGIQLRVEAPLLSLSKTEVLALAQRFKITGTYSCHAGSQKPCGVCVSCREKQRAMQSV